MIPGSTAVSALRGRPDRIQMHLERWKKERKHRGDPYPNTLGSYDLTGLSQSLQNRCSLPAERRAWGRCGIEPSYVPEPYILHR
jgi:hypothetical protein